MCVCACVRACVFGGSGANLKTVKIVTLHWNQSNLIIIIIHLNKVSTEMNLKIPCTSCSDLTAKHDACVDSLFHQRMAISL